MIRKYSEFGNGLRCILICTCILVTRITLSEATTVQRDSECGKTVGCFHDCSGDTCSFLLTWLERGDNIKLTLTCARSESNPYCSIGLSDDEKMGDDSVFECLSNGTAQIYLSYNPGQYNMRLDENQYGLSDISTSYNNGVLKCSFLRQTKFTNVTGRKKRYATGADSYFDMNSDLRQTKFTNVTGRKKRYATGADSYFDMNSDWYLQYAHGTTTAGYLMKHTSPPLVSTKRADFQRTIDISERPIVDTVQTVQKDSECGKTVGCFHDCSGDTCSFLLTWLEMGDDIELTLTCARSESNPYCSIGLSDDQKMGDDSVFECLSASGTPQIYLSYNSGQSNSRLDQNQYGLSGISTSYDNGLLKCSFLRKKNITNIAGRKNRSTLSSNTYFDMNRDWYLQYAHGTTTTGGSLNKHTSPPLVSAVRADFQSTVDLSATTVKRPLVKAHGILMVFAWTLFSTLGVFAARFYKTAWPDQVEWFGVKPWFMIHRFCMVSVLVLTSISFVMIFVDVDGYVTIVGATFKKSHPVLGIIIMALVVLNPVMAFFRPKPGTSKRVIFRVAHTIVGVAGQIMAIVNMFSGVILDSVQISSASTILLAAFCGWTFVVEIGLFFYDCYLSKKDNRTFELELQGSGNVGKEKSVKKSNYNMLKIFVLAFHIIALTAFSATVSALIGSAE